MSEHAEAAIRIELEPRPLERAPADVAVAGIFSDDRPLRGGAGRLDWRLCGLVSELLMAGEMSGAAGEAVLIPSWPNLRAPRIMLLGLGEQGRYRMASAEDATRDAIARCLRLATPRVAMAPLGIASDDLPRHAPALIGGMLEAIRTVGGQLHVALTVRPSELDRAGKALEAAVRAVAAPELILAPRPALREPAASAVGRSYSPVGAGSTP